MNSDLYNFSKNLDRLDSKDMFAISQNLNTIEPSVGEVARAAPFLENLTFLDWTSIAFVVTILVFSLLPRVKKSKLWGRISHS